MLYAIIMAGGSGTRFWPKSRRNRPKQLLKLFGDETMLQQTVRRIEPLVPRERIVIVTGADQAEETRAQLPDLPAANIVAEPCPRDTAACVGLAAWIVRKANPEATMIVMPADHVIEPAETFLTSVRAAVAVIEGDPTTLVTFGIEPTRPE
ncbi:MAG: NTP transferase domain-containing protein, partial [Planctomycetaceae bacterium]|nr:NTP transferase domain-containing protein [Planctomycetaceae bacterium]